MARASLFQSECRRFESGIPLSVVLAQLVARLLAMEKVASSNLAYDSQTWLSGSDDPVTALAGDVRIIGIECAHSVTNRNFASIAQHGQSGCLVNSGSGVRISLEARFRLYSLKVGTPGIPCNKPAPWMLSSAWQSIWPTPRVSGVQISQHPHRSNNMKGGR